MNIQPVESFTTLDYTELLELRITQFEPDTKNQMILQGTWKIQPVTGKESSSHFFRLIIPAPIGKPSMTDLVSSMNQELESLAREIASQL
jgi:uncharacterized lipoprotein YmbA